MKYFIDTANNNAPYALEDDVSVSGTPGAMVFTTSFGMKLNLPPTLSPVLSLPTIALTQAETVAIISADIQSALDAGAQKWNYQDLATAASYANSTIPQYAADAKALIAWRDAVWSWAIPQFATIVAGTDPQTFMANMPVQPTQPKV